MPRVNKYEPTASFPSGLYARISINRPPPPAPIFRGSAVHLRSRVERAPLYYNSIRKVFALDVAGMRVPRRDNSRDPVDDEKTRLYVCAAQLHSPSSTRSPRRRDIFRDIEGAAPLRPSTVQEFSARFSDSRSFGSRSCYFNDWPAAWPGDAGKCV